MKHLFVCFILVFSCATKQRPAVNDEISSIPLNCPGDGVCTFSVMNDQSFSIEKDGIAALYPKFFEGNTIIIKFEYKRNEIPNTKDGQYSELVYLELDPNNLEIDLKDGTLRSVKALYARLCFCRGQTGYYPINQGQISIEKLSKNQYHLKMEFKINEVPQVVTTIDKVFYIK